MSSSGHGRAIIGPTRAAARLEGSKIFSKQFMQRHSIPTAAFKVAESFDQAVKALPEFGLPVVIKADGLAAGKGVVIAHTREEAEKTLDEFMRQRTLGSAGEKVILEEALRGEELSFIVLTDGRAILPLVPTQDHKAVFDDDQGPNTGGMGAYSEDAILDEPLRAEIIRTIVAPTLVGMAVEGTPYHGFLYCGLMFTSQGPQASGVQCTYGRPRGSAHCHAPALGPGGTASGAERRSPCDASNRTGARILRYAWCLRREAIRASRKWAK